MQGYFHLARQFLAKRKIRFVFLLISIAIGIASLFVLLSLHLGVQQFLTSKAVAAIGVNEIVVRPKFRKSLMVTKQESKEITQAALEEVQNIPGVSTVYPIMGLRMPTSVQLNLFSNTLESDAPVFGVAPEFVESDLADPNSFNASAPELPVVLSKDLVDFFNAGFAASLGQPQINEELLLGRTFTLFLGYSSFLGFKGPDVVEVPARIVGLSNKVPVIGISIPLTKVQEYSTRFQREEGKVNSLFVTVESPVQVEPISQQIENMGYATDSLQKRISGVKDNLKILTLILGSISLIILISVAISIFNTFFSDVFESIATIGILRSVGATKGFIAALILSKSVLISFWGGLIGILLGTLISWIINNWLLKDLPFFATQNISVVATPWQLFAGVFVFALLLGTVASLYPAYYGARMDPAQALRR